MHLTAASTAILNLWVKKAKHSIVSRSNEVAATLRAEQAALLSQIHESEDWYYGAEMRLDGHKIKKEGEQIYEDRKSKEEEARAKKAHVESNFEEFRVKMRSVIEAKNVALDEAMEEERGAAMKEADSRSASLRR